MTYFFLQNWFYVNIFLTRIEQKGMTFDHDFCYSFSFSSPPSFFVREKIRGKENQSRGQKSCLSARSLLGLEQQNMCGTLNMMYVLS